MWYSYLHVFLHLNSIHRLGGKLDDYPHPELDMAGFVNFLDVKLAEAGQTWDPMSKKDKPWIDKRKLVAAYGSKGCTIS